MVPKKLVCKQTIPSTTVRTPQGPSHTRPYRVIPIGLLPNTPPLPKPV